MFGSNQGDPRWEAGYETEEDQMKRERSERIKKEIDPVPLSAFTVSELPALLIFLGFRMDPRVQGPYLSLAEAEKLLEQKLLRAARDRADHAESVGYFRRGSQM